MCERRGDDEVFPVRLQFGGGWWVGEFGRVPFPEGGGTPTPLGPAEGFFDEKMPWIFVS